MHVETDFTKNFYASSPLVQGYQVVERELGGAGVWDIMLPAPLSITSEYLDEVLELERQLHRIARIPRRQPVWIDQSAEHC